MGRQVVFDDAFWIQLKTLISIIDLFKKISIHI